MLSERLRALTADFTQAIGAGLGRTGLSPNVFTLAGFAAVVFDALLIGLGYLQVAGVFLVAALLLDALDGAVARATGRVSAFGGFLDSTLDRWAEVALFFGMAVALSRIGSMLDLALVYWAICGSLLVSYTRARAESIGIICKEGLFTRFERMVVIVLGLLTTWLTLALGLIAVLATLTAAQRLWFVWRRSGAPKV